MAIVYLPFVLLVFLIISSLISIILAFYLRGLRRFNIVNISFLSGLISLLLSYWFHISSYSNYGYLSSGGVNKVIDGVITFDGYLSTFYYSLVFAFIGSIVGLTWFFILKKLDNGGNIET